MRAFLIEFQAGPNPLQTTRGDDKTYQGILIPECGNLLIVEGDEGELRAFVNFARPYTLLREIPDFHETLMYQAKHFVEAWGDLQEMRPLFRNTLRGAGR